jgi:hypothetical protein
MIVSLREIKLLVRSLNHAKMMRLNEWLRSQIQSFEETKHRPVGAQREVIEERSVDSKTYRLAGVRCGKENCRCADGDLHGPYWYAYWSEQGKTKSQYIGKKLPRQKRK